MTKTKVGHKVGRAYVDKTTSNNLEVKMKMCPLSGISCADCGYKSVLGHYDCFIEELITVLNQIKEACLEE